MFLMFRKKTWDGLHQDVILLIIKLSCIMLKNAQTYSKTPQGFYSMFGDAQTYSKTPQGFCSMFGDAQTYSKTPQGFYSMFGDFSTSWIKGLGVSMLSIVFLMLFHDDVYHVKTQ